ncbi:MAG: CorA family divalent cation transporter [Hyphomicrobium sp.]|uniref:CorA family divalent cation transporter n=1 Tax=Hyphomicrobium sp. TaxID=82 RepID=UPI0039E3134D
MLDDVRSENPPCDPLSSRAAFPDTRIGQFRQILLWPVELVPLHPEAADHNFAAVLSSLGADNPWKVVDDEFTGDPKNFQERHYNEFVTFLPPVQRFLYGSNPSKTVGSVSSESPVTTFRRTDIATLRVVLTPGAKAIDLKVEHIDLYFFFEIDVVILALEISTNDIGLADVQDVMFRLGRTHPAYWEKGTDVAGHCPAKVEFLSEQSVVVVASDYEDRDRFLTHVCAKRAARVAAHWQYLLFPLVPHHSDLPGMLRYKQLEYYRMPQMAFIAVQPDSELTRADYVRLAFASGPGSCQELPFSDRHLEDFEKRYCYDRYFGKHNEIEWPQSRYMSCGHALVVTGSAENPFFVDPNHGCLNSFRHEHFLVFLIAHFHKASLLMFSDRLTAAMSRLDAHSKSASIAFRMASRRALQTFLRFTHRYWFYSVSNQTQAHDLFALCRTHLDIDRLYNDIRQEIQEMSEFLENEAMRRQNDTVTRLTVVTTLGLVATTVTGFLGMNLLDWANQSTEWRLLAFTAVLVPTVILTLIAVANSRVLSDIMESLSDGSARWLPRLRRKPKI